MQKLFTQQLRFKSDYGTDFPAWEEKKLGEFCKTYSGGTPKSGTAEYYDGEIPFIRSGEISSNKTELFLTEKGMENSSAKMVSKGDILYALYGANSGLCSISKIDGAINQAILCIKTKEKKDSYVIIYNINENTFIQLTFKVDKVIFLENLLKVL